jgi:hypothetical protein
MTELEDNLGSGVTCAVAVSPTPVDAGGELTVRVTATCAEEARDLRGESVQIEDGDGQVLAEATFVKTDEGAFRTEELTLKAPADVGTFTLAAVLHGSGVRPEVRAPFSVETQAHRVDLVVWDVPSAVEGGAHFTIKVGLRCSSGCALSGSTVEIVDQEGAVRREVTLGPDPWAGTAALYHGEADLEAVTAEGLHSWSARALSASSAVAHRPAATDFGLRVVHAPEFRVRVEVVDRASQTPVKGAKVVLHPYRTFTDEHGVAEMNVASGDYAVFVSGRKYIPFRTGCSLDCDLTIRAELDLDVGLSDADVWA